MMCYLGAMSRASSHALRHPPATPPSQPAGAPSAEPSVAIEKARRRGRGAQSNASGRYEAEARVFVDTRTALRPALQGLTTDQNVDAQINFVRQALLEGPQLEKIAQDTGVMRIIFHDQQCCVIRQQIVAVIRNSFCRALYNARSS